MLIQFAERRFLPDAAIRAGIRRLLTKRLRQEERRFASGDRGKMLAAQFASGPIAEATDAARTQHYEVPARFFELMLGPRLKYSCGLWNGADADLAAAEEAMLGETCRRAEIADGQRILDLGCGWGSLALWMAEKYPGAEIIAVSNSASQHEFVTARAALRGQKNFRHVVGDVASPEPWLGDLGAFDRIVSVEMFEHLHNVAALLEAVTPLLANDGRLFVHIFCHRELFYQFADESNDDWMARNFFTGGAMPPADLFEHVAGPLTLLKRWDVNGTLYARTCRAWLANLDAHRDEIVDCFAPDLPPAAARRQWQRWRMFVMACEELFAFGGGDEWFVSHHLLALR